MSTYLLAIDQGTTSTRAIIFNAQGETIAKAQQEITQYFPKPGWVEHCPEQIWQTVVNCIKEALAKANLTAKDILGLGISNQRETTLLWHKHDGTPLYKAIVWQDRRTADDCHHLLNEGIEPVIQQKTGLLLDPYFSASKIRWLLDNIPNARKLADASEIVFGTIDTFLLWRLTNGKVHATDITNASRTSLFNLTTEQFDDELLKLFAIPKQILPSVFSNTHLFGYTDQRLFGTEIPIFAMAGDQQAALIGQAAFEPGMIKATYGTGCFLLLNTGKQRMHSTHRLLTTIAYKIHQQLVYGLEGSIFVAGAAVQWLRDAMKLIHNASESEGLAESLGDNGGVYLVPAFTGLGAPYWDPLARGAILGLTRDTGVNHIVRAALEAICYQTNDLLIAMQKDTQLNFTRLKVDGGMIHNHWLMQFLANILNVQVLSAKTAEVSALGVAMLVGLQAGLYKDLEAIQAHWQYEKIYQPNIGDIERTKLYNGWLKAVNTLLTQGPIKNDASITR